MVVIPAFRELLGADGSTTGIITVAVSNKYWPGAVANIDATGMNGMKVIILELPDATHIRVKLHPDEGVSADGRSTRQVGQGPANLTGYTTANGAAINVPQQTVMDMPQGGVIPRLPNFWPNT